MNLEKKPPSLALRRARASKKSPKVSSGAAPIRKVRYRIVLSDVMHLKESSDKEVPWEN